MNSYLEKWNALGAGKKAGLATSAVAALALAIGLGVWAYRPDYQLLFANLNTPDAAAMAAELDRMKVPYRLAEGGTTIMVPHDVVYKTRLQLMGGDIPLHGAVGFEVFNNADFGMTEFVQKVNYQRASQGELTRTIQSIDGIQSARVHLAMPEQGMFKKSEARPKASVTLTLKPRHVMDPAQVTGIQRLVAAAVPDMAPADVTVLDQHGVALTRAAAAAAEGDSGSAQLDAKRSAEQYVMQKVTQVLDRTFGAGQAIASVDLVLNLDQTRVTTDDVVPVNPGGKDTVASGLAVRERVTSRDPQAGAAADSVVTSSETDYQAGRRVAQVVTAPGATRRMTIAVVVNKSIDESQIGKLKEVVGLAAGFNAERGDAIVVYPMDRLANIPATVPATPATLVQAAEAAPAAQPETEATPAVEVWSVLLAVLGLAVAALLTLLGARAKASRQAQAAAPRLSGSERERVLGNLRAWMETDSQAPAPQRRPE